MLKTVSESRNDPLLVLGDDQLMLLEDDIISLVDDDEPVQTQAPPWKVMVVDDDEAVHHATTLALKNFLFEGRSLALIHAFSGAEAQQLLHEHNDIAFVMLDVVMETHDAGLKVVRYIRDDLNNHRVQIVLRTGQPGEAPEESIIRNYDINDYKLKVELTRQRLITTAIAAIRAYRNVIAVAEKTTALTQTLTTLQNTQLQLVQSEKMSALGNLVAGVAHEINNPTSFLQGNIQPAKDYTTDLFELIDFLLDKYGRDDPEVQEFVESIDLDFIREDLPQLLSSMMVGINRIRNISKSLRIFSRKDHNHKVPFNIHDGINSTLMILQHRTKGNEYRPNIEIIKDYDNLPAIKCFSGQMNQVFMNILANAIDMFDEVAQRSSFKTLQANPQTITIETQCLSTQDCIEIRIRDNGVGMPVEVQAKVFDHLFTTKGVGKGTGLGLAIAHQIVVDTHDGELNMQSEIGQGTEFCIRLPI